MLLPAGRAVPAEACVEVEGAEEAAAVTIGAAAGAGGLTVLPSADWTAERSVLPTFCMIGVRSSGVPSPICRVTGLLSHPCKPMYNLAPAQEIALPCNVAGQVLCL